MESQNVVCQKPFAKSIWGLAICLGNISAPFRNLQSYILLAAAPIFINITDLRISKWIQIFPKKIARPQMDFDIPHSDFHILPFLNHRNAVLIVKSL